MISHLLARSSNGGGLVVEWLPSLVVALGLLAIWVMRHKPNAVAAAAVGVIDIAWCGVSLFAKQVLFVADANIEAQPSILVGMLLGALVPTLALMAIPSRRWRVWVSWSAATFGSLVLLTDGLYSRWFGDMFPAVALLATGHIGSVADSAWDLVAGRDAWLVVDLILAVPLMMAVSRLPEAGRLERRLLRSLALAGSLVLLVAGWQTAATMRADHAIVEQRFSNRELVKHTGPLVYHVLDGWILLQRSIASRLLTDETFEDIQTWFAERRSQRAGVGPWFGAARGMNLIVIQVESLQAPMVALRVNGRAVMPNLFQMQSQGLSFSHVYDQTAEGRTSDAEWMGSTSLLPAAQGAAAFIDAGNQLVGLPSVLADEGYQSLSAVAFEPSFWNRRVIHPRFGFSRSLFAADFGPGERIGWGLNDRDFLLQMAPALTNAQEPFAAWLITQSLHYPFPSFPERHKSLDVRPWNNTPFGNYIHGMHHFDLALGDFMATLERAGRLANTLVVVTGDHSVGFPWNPDIAHAFGFSNDLLHWNLAERVPLVIHVPGRSPETISIPVGQVDIAPTLLGLLGIDSVELPYVGRNVLGEPRAEPIVRRNGSWVDAQHLFVMRSGTIGTHCFNLNALADVPIAACAEGSARAARQTEISRLVREFDLQQRLGVALSSASPRSTISRH